MSTDKNPFVGLRPFESRDSLYYFGRNQQTMELLKYLSQTRFVAVVGSSGSGKSSLVRAGLIPNLEAGFLVRDRDLWHIAIMKPEDRPLYHLAAALLQTVGDNPSDEQKSEFAGAINDRGIHAVLEKLVPVLLEEEGNLFLLVDQFEEVFRFGVYTGDSGKREEASAFADILLRLAGQDDIPVYVCLTMRSDYIGDCDAFYGLPEAMNRSQYLVPRLTRRQRREAIEGPIRLSGAAIAPRLLDRLLNESGANRDDLPVLQHALMRTWNEWAKEGIGPIDMAHYESIETMERALSLHADEALNELTDEEKEVAKHLFQTLTETDAENRRIRRAAHLNEIADVIAAPIETIMRIIGKFREDSRSFLVLSSETAEDNPVVDISHESLMRQWDTLGTWMDEEAESAKIYKRLAEGAELYKQGEAGFYTDPALQFALDWKKRKKPRAAWGKRYHKDFKEAMSFLKQSRNDRDEKIRKEENKRKEHERMLREKQYMINYNLAKFFELKAMNALKSAHEQKSVFGYKEVWLYTAAALKQEVDKDKMTLQPASAGALLTPGVINAAFSEKWILHEKDSHADFYKAVQFSPDGKTMAYGSFDTTIRLRQVASGKVIRTFTGHSRGVTSVAFSPDGKTLASGSLDETIRLWDMASGKEIRTFTGHSSYVTGVAFSPDGKTLASGSDDKTIRFWDVASGKEIRTFTGHSEKIRTVVFSPDGKTLASVSWETTIRVWDVFTGKEIRISTGQSRGVTSAAFSPDGKTLASGSNDDTICLWDAASGKEIRTFTGHSGEVYSVAFNPDGKTLASGSDDNTIRLWDVASGKETGKLTGHSEMVRTVVFSPDGKTLASRSLDTTIRLWDLTQVAPGKEKRPLTGHSGTVFSLAISPDAKTLASGSDDNTIRLWDLASGKETGKLTGHASDVTSVAFSPDSKTLATGSFDKTIRLWDLTHAAAGKEIRQLTGHSDGVESVAFSPDGKTLASVSDDNTIRLWDVASGKDIRTLTGHSEEVISVVFSPDGKTIASGSGDYTIRLWDVDSGKEILLLTGHSGNVTSVTFSPDGKIMASGSDDNTIRLWDVASGKEIRTLTGHSGAVISVVFSPDGKTIASGSGDYTVRLWDVDSGKEIQPLTGHSGNVTSVTFSPDGKTLASGSDDNTIRLWDMSIFNLCLKEVKPTPLFYTFSEGAEYFCDVELESLEYKKRSISYPDDKKFRPLLDPPAPGQTKFQQILEWAKKQQK